MITRGTSESQHANLWAFSGRVPRPPVISDHSYYCSDQKETETLGPLASALQERSLFRPDCSVILSLEFARVEFIISHMLTRLPATESRGVSSGPLVRPRSSICGVCHTGEYSVQWKDLTGHRSPGALAFACGGIRRIETRRIRRFLGTKPMWTRTR